MKDSRETTIHCIIRQEKNRELLQLCSNFCRYLMRRLDSGNRRPTESKHPSIVPLNNIRGQSDVLTSLLAHASRPLEVRILVSFRRHQRSELSFGQLIFELSP